jgi:hypothetical protein
MRRLLPLFLLLLGGCSVIAPPTQMVAIWSRDWHAIATDNDRQRLRDWRTSFTDALSAANKSGHSAEIAREGALLQPDAALGGGPIPNGMYRCRVIKLGASTQGLPDYLAAQPAVCRVKPDRDLQRLGVLTGPQRMVGLIFPGDAVRQVFLGTLVLGDETRALQYGQDQTRDVAGYVERIGPARWRLVMPKPHFESRLDVMELVPAH